MKHKWFKCLTFFLTFLLMGLSMINLAKIVQAETVINYNLDTKMVHERSGLELAEDVEVIAGERLLATYQLTFPDSQSIAENDKLVLVIPKELRLITNLTFDVTNTNGKKVGIAQTDPSTGKVTVTFTDYFAKRPEKKELLLQFNLTINREVVKESQPVTVTIGHKTYSFKYKQDSGEAGDYEMKYGYQDDTDPSIIKWRILLNANQDMIRGMTITDTFGDGQTLIPESFRAVRYETQPTKIRNEAHILTLEPSDNFSKKAVFTKNAQGGITGFTIPFGDNYHWAMYIEYSTKLPDGVPTGSLVSNTLSWSATNFETRSIVREVRLESGSGLGGAEKSENVVLKAQKILKGKALEKDQFSFGLYDANNLVQPIQIAKNAEDGSVTFNAIKYAKEGVYHYLIKEMIPENSGHYDYDRHELKVTVTVTDDDGIKMGTVAYGEEKTTFTNVYRGTTSIKGKKIWNDAENQDGIRPDTIRVRLLANGSEVASKNVRVENSWSYSFDNIPENDPEGKAIVYTVAEDHVEGYTTEIDQKNYTITNTHVPEVTDLKVSKRWEDADNKVGKRPNNIKIQLYANGKKVGKEVTLSEDNKWDYTFSNLPKHSAGKVINYTIAEVKVPEGYVSKTIQENETHLVLVNTYQPPVPPTIPTTPNKKTNPPKPSPPKSPDKSKDRVLPKTGEEATTALLVLGLGIGLVGLALVKCRK